MIFSDIDERRALRDIAKHVEKMKNTRIRNRSVELLHEFGLSDPTIGIALGITSGQVAHWYNGTRACPVVRQAELDALLRNVCGLVLRRYEELPEQAWVVFGHTYHKALAYLGESSLVTLEERAMLSNAAPRLEVSCG